ncbi:leucyl aminopeptidase [SAR202 cluster bacterium AD-804-J14_MRT_500m]|nr:leucyl aminopeptidase [SAR202 cluster bacterium AD-804-J14_MRT_500m]
MDIRVIKDNPINVKSPVLIVSIFEKEDLLVGISKEIDQALEGAFHRLIDDGEIKGAKGELTLIHTFDRIGPSRILVVGLGKEEQFDINTIRETMGQACRFLRSKRITSISTVAHGIGIPGIESKSSGQAIAEGTLLGLYKFSQYQDEHDSATDIGDLTIIENKSSDVESIRNGVRIGTIIAEGTCLTRDMSNEPANIMTPARMSEIARQVADSDGLGIEVLEQKDMESLGMGALLGVAKGSHQPPKLIVLKYTGNPDNPSDNLGFIGKGITFDTGGISLKPAGGMENMKGDMTGGASVIGTMQAIARLKPKLNLTGIVPATENMPGGEAQRPGDVVRAMNGKTIEVINTDAEGRLVLSDAMVYATRNGINRMVDIATLTGAIVVSLGKICTGVMGNDQDLIDKVISAATSAGEKMWQLPMYDEYKEQLKSNIADMMNVGGRDAGSITAAKFLSEFAGNTPWVHLDIAGTYRSDTNKGYMVKGSSGIPVRTLIDLALAEAS